jgi:putative methyltransferase (TIGR04325 family)
MDLNKFLNSIKYFIKKSLAKQKKTPAKYTTFKEATDACLGYGYENEMLVDVVYKKTLRYKDEINSSLPLMAFEGSLQSMIGILLLQLNSNKKKTINVIDLGGACGAHYFYMRTALGNKTSFKWHIVETPAMVNKAKALETDELRFFNTITTAKDAFDTDIDYFYSSGAIQCVPDPENTLKEILDCKARYITLSRLALSLGSQEVIIIQESMLSTNGPGPLPVGIQDRLCKYPLIYFPKHRLEELIREKYSIVLRFGESTSNIIENQRIINTGYFAERLNE